MGARATSCRDLTSNGLRIYSAATLFLRFAAIWRSEGMLPAPSVYELLGGVSESNQPLDVIAVGCVCS
jgi:hypothetical protein